jgi:transketolase
MRQAFGEAIVGIGHADPRVVMIDCETATSTFAIHFGKTFPDRFIQMGVAEQNAISFAAGLSTTGFVPIVPLFGCFSTRRAGDQVFCQVAYPKFNVKIMGCFAGMSSPNTGATHQALQDVAMMRALPHMLVLEPADEPELRQALVAVFEHVGPVYFRMIRGDVGGGSPTVSPPGYRFRLGKAAVLRDGSDVTLVGSGLMVSRCLEAAGILAAKGIAAEVINVSTVKPLDVDGLVSSAEKTGAVVVAENHSVIGGLGGAVAEALTERCPVPMRRVGVKDRFGESGPLEDLFEKYGLTAGAVVKAAEEVIRLRRQ